MTDPAATILKRPYRWVTIGACALVFLAAFETLAVTTIMPVVSRELDGASLYALAFAGPLATGVIAAYLLVMGIVIVVKALRRHRASTTRAKLVPLAFAGGFCDSVGGGGWGPIVVGTLLARGDDPRYTIGSANAAEFFVTLAASITFIITIGLGNWMPIIGLALGGAVAAPIAAWLTSRVPRRPMLGLVGVVVILLSARTIWKAVV